MRHPPQQRSLSRCRCHRLPPARKRKGCGGDFRLRCPWAGRGRWRPWCCCGRGWRGPAAPRWVSARRPRSRLPQRPALTCPDTPSPFSPQLSSGGALAAAPRSWRPLPIGAPRPGKATVRPSRDTVRPAPRGSPRRGWVCRGGGSHPPRGRHPVCQPAPKPFFPPSSKRFLRSSRTACSSCARSTHAWSGLPILSRVGDFKWQVSVTKGRKN